MRHYWDTKIVCAKASLLDFAVAVERFTGGVRSMFSTFAYGDHGQLAFFPAEQRNPILQAGQDNTLLRLTYEGIPRLVEPYMLSFKRRLDGVGQEYLYVYDTTGGRSGPGIKSLFNWKISHIENTDIKFKPRFEVQLSKAGELGSRTHFGSPFGTGRRPTRRRGRSAKLARYEVQCNYCLRTFPRTTSSTRLRPHRDKLR